MHVLFTFGELMFEYCFAVKFKLNFKFKCTCSFLFADILMKLTVLLERVPGIICSKVLNIFLTIIAP